MKLQLLITQYTETEDIIKPMLTSIEAQQGVDLKKDIEVVIGNDGSDVKLSKDFLGSFSYPIRYNYYEHSGLPGCRKNLFNDSTADYVMFCDADDMFINNLAFNIIFTFMEKGFDALVCDFIEEIVDRKLGKSFFPAHKKDRVFVHGKIYRRQYLLDNGIVWHPEIRCHEDSCFNILALRLAKDLKYCPIPLYLWKWRDHTICRGDTLYVPKTYVHMIESNEQLIQDFLDRGKVEEAKEQVAILTYGTYYMLNKPIGRDPLNVKYRYLTEKRFQEYYRKHKEMLRTIDPRVEKNIIRGTKTRVLGEGVLLESFTFDAWIRHIEEL